MILRTRRVYNLLQVIALSLLLLLQNSWVSSSSSDNAGVAEVGKGENLAAMAGGLMGQPKEVHSAENSVEFEDLGKFAVQEHNSKEGKNLTFKKIVTAKKQVVSGTIYHLTVEATHPDTQQPKTYEAKVWTKPWENHKTLEHFKEVDSSSST